MQYETVKKILSVIQSFEFVENREFKNPSKSILPELSESFS